MDGQVADEQVLAEVRRITATEDEPLAAARARAGSTTRPPSPEIGALLRWAVSTTRARAVVEVGAAGGVSGLWLLQALPDRGVLTSIEPDAHEHGLARQAYDEAGAGDRLRSILDDPVTVLPRLSDGAYEVVLLQAAPASYPEQLQHARRLLRPSGLLIARHVLRPGEQAEALARFVQELADDPGLIAAVLPIDDGLAIATRVEVEDEHG